MSDDLPTFAEGPGLAWLPGSVPVASPGVARPPEMSDDAVRRAVLDKIASGEANSYSELYGGSTFKGFSQHPNIAIPIAEGPNKGQNSTAAGRYQFIKPTWDAQAKKLGLKDFSPDSQDAAAWDLAKTTYLHETGRDLASDVRAGTPRWSALGGQWTSLANGGKAQVVSQKTPASGQAQSASTPPSPTGQLVQSSAAEAQRQQLALGMLQKIMAQPQASQMQVAYDPSKYLYRPS